MNLMFELSQGYHAASNERLPYLNTSPAANAWRVGRHLAMHYLPMPSVVTQGRGNTVNTKQSKQGCKTVFRIWPNGDVAKA